MPLVPVPFLSPSPLLILLLVAVLLTIPTRRLSAAESPAQGEDCEQESSGEDGVVEEEGGVEGDVVGAPAREDCPRVAILRLFDAVDVYCGRGDQAKQREEYEEERRRE